MRLNNMKFTLFILFIISLSLNLAQVKQYKQNGVSYIENGENGQEGNKELIENMTIGGTETDKKYLFSNFTALAVDESNNIYVTDSQQQIRKFGKNGKFITTFGRIGEGPGEFRRVRKLIYKNGFVYLLDPLLKRITKYSSDGKYKAMIKLYDIAVDFVINSKNEFILLVDDFAAKLRFVKYNEEGKIVGRFGEKVHSKSITEDHFYNTGKITIDNNDNIYLGLIQPYRIEKYDNRGQLSSIISRKIDFPIVKISSSEIKEEGKSLTVIYKGEGGKLPSIITRDICFSMDRIYHLVSKTLKKDYFIDVFDSHGQYLYRINLRKGVEKIQCLKNKIILLEENLFENFEPDIAVFSLPN